MELRTITYFKKAATERRPPIFLLNLKPPHPIGFHHLVLFKSSSTTLYEEQPSLRRKEKCSRKQNAIDQAWFFSFLLISSGHRSHEIIYQTHYHSKNCNCEPKRVREKEVFRSIHPISFSKRTIFLNIYRPSDVGGKDEQRSSPPVTAESAQELLDELLDFDKFGTRGEGWFLAQAVLILFVVFPPGPFRQIVDTLGFCLLLGGLALITAGGLDLGQSLTPVPKPRENNHVLVTDGVYKLVAHPMYGGILLSAAGLALVTGDEARIALTALMAFVLDQKASIEEEYLEEKYPGQYERYKESGVKKFIPYFW